MARRWLTSRCEYAPHRRRLAQNQTWFRRTFVILYACANIACTKASETNVANHHHADKLHAVVSAWVQNKHQGETTTTSLEWDSREVSLLQRVAPAAAAAYHPHTGCTNRLGECCCYPSKRILQNLVGYLGTGPSTIVEFGSFLGETTLGLADAVESRAPKNDVRIVAMDTWKDTTGLGGVWTAPMKWNAPSGLLVAIGANESFSDAMQQLAYYQFLANVNANPAAKFRVTALPLLSMEAVGRASIVGSTYPLPSVVYLNPPVDTASLRHEILPQLWRLLACGGTLIGHGYHKMQSEVDDFALHVGGQLETHVVHAPGSLKWERDLDFSHEILAANQHSNFSYFALRGKACIPQGGGSTYRLR